MCQVRIEISCSAADCTGNENKKRGAKRGNRNKGEEERKLKEKENSESLDRRCNFLGATKGLRHVLYLKSPNT
jgi:hypothetical protein